MVQRFDLENSEARSLDPCVYTLYTVVVFLYCLSVDFP